jgi:hypothetical protein
MSGFIPAARVSEMYRQRLSMPLRNGRGVHFFWILFLCIKKSIPGLGWNSSYENNSSKELDFSCSNMGLCPKPRPPFFPAKERPAPKKGTPFKFLRRSLSPSLHLRNSPCRDYTSIHFQGFGQSNMLYARVRRPTGICTGAPRGLSYLIRRGHAISSHQQIRSRPLS